ncbi:MAG TPA: sensor histidine kinase, partial [Bacteroidia bacterium]|nr:sensor histidine kinase [Bacteroidia bacterium]
KGYISDKKVLDIFQDCQNRIYTMAAIHEKLYENNALSNINFNEYMKKLITQLIDTYQLKFNIKYNIEVDIDRVDMDILIPIGLLSNEIISNSLKYAFSDDKKNNVITFKLKKETDTTFTMLIGDNGKGSRISLEEEHTTFGLDLIKILVDQLHGSIKRLEMEGTIYEINFNTY